MDIEPTEAELNKLNEALSQLADLISDEINPDKTALEKVLHNVGLNKNHHWIRSILEQASPLLEKAHDDIRGGEKQLIVTNLEALGIKRFAAILTYDKAQPKPLSAEPPSVNFGCLKIGEGANTTLKISGGLVNSVINNPRLKVSLLQTGAGTTLAKIQLSPGNAGDSFIDQIVFRSNRGDLRVPVSAQWEKAADEPPLLSWCPECGPNHPDKKSLFFNKYTRKYECFRCKQEFPYPNKHVSEYNKAHR